MKQYISNSIIAFTLLVFLSACSEDDSSSSDNCYIQDLTGDCNIADDELCHDGVIYKTIISGHTGKIWLDRNLGALRVCEDINDSSCFGDYYQWGRYSDGHENVTSLTTEQQSEIICTGHDKFITIANGNFDWTAVDENGSKRMNYWAKFNGTSICPLGFKVPNIDELLAENIQNTDDAYNKFKLPVSGSRNTYGELNIDTLHSNGVWSNSISSHDGLYLRISTYNSGKNDNYRFYGRTIRCIKDD